MTTIETNQAESNNIHQKLIEECKKMDQKAQFLIYKLYYKTIFTTILRIVNDPLEAEEIMQESFLVAFEQIRYYSGDVSFSAWLNSIVQNQPIDNWKKNKDLIFEEIGYACETTNNLNNN